MVTIWFDFNRRLDLHPVSTVWLSACRCHGWLSSSRIVPYVQDTSAIPRQDRRLSQNHHPLGRNATDPPTRQIRALSGPVPHSTHYWWRWTLFQFPYRIMEERETLVVNSMFLLVISWLAIAAPAASRCSPSF